MSHIRLFAIGLALVASTAGARAPDFVRGGIECTAYDGVSDDLLTAGLGKTGLQGAAPGFVDANNPTAAELRKRAIYNNYRALVDMSPNGGYGTLFGPNVDPNGTATASEGKIAGEECLAFADDGSGSKNVTLMVQIPHDFDRRRSCIVAAPSSGSRGVYGAIGTAGEAGLKLGCAVAYTDKGTGMGTHDLQNDTVNLINGLRESARRARDESNFTADVGRRELVRFNAATPNRFAFKHAHSQQNPENDWGRNVLQSIELALFLLDDRFGKISKRNTIVIASSVSNGGGASLLAAERDRAGLIDGVAVAEPMIQPRANPALRIERGGAPVAAQAKPLFDYTTLANLFQVCAGRSSALAASPLRAADDPRAVERCAALERANLVEGSNTEERANDALAKLRAAGWEAESDLLHVSHWALATPAIAVTYANTYGRFSVLDNACGFSFGATDAGGNPAPAATASVAQIFANGNGIPPTSGISLINNNSVGGPKLDAASFSPNSTPTGVQDYNAPGALCLRDLNESKQVSRGIERVRASGSVRGKPTVIVHGRADTLVPVNHSSRAFVGLNGIVEGSASRVRYYEVTNAQHFEAFLGVAGYDNRFIPLHVYFNQAVKMMYDHLKWGTPLSPSQVVRTTPRGGAPGAAPPITPGNVPPISPAPAAGNQILMTGSTLQIPD